MERILSVEEKIRRAEEIYARRHEGAIVNIRPSTTTSKINNTPKDIKLLRKMIIQIIVCVCLYLTIYAAQNYNFIFSENFINKAKEILSYDTNFIELYESIKQSILNFGQQMQQGIIPKQQQNQTQDENQMQEEQTTGEEQQEQQQEAIGGAEETQEENKEPLTQAEQDILDVKKTTNFAKPIEGPKTISSKYGHRDPTTATVPKNHTGTDIACNLGTKIKAATEGEVVLVSEEGDYGKHIKIQIGEVSIIYAHCNSLYVKQGEHIKQGQEIAEVGSTGNSTGPHLHFEIRYQERTVDPEKVLQL